MGKLRSMAADTISFARGAPSLDIVDVEGLKAAAARAFENDPGGTTAYGTAIGYVPLRKWIAEQHGVEPEQVLVTNGSMQADAFLFDELVGAGDTVVVERPTYDRTLLSLRERGADMRMVELEPDGIDVEELGRAARAAACGAKLAHVIPNFQNPAGYTLSREQARRAARARARRTSFVIFEDDPYAAIRFSGEPLPTMLDARPRRERRLRVVVLQDRLPGHPRRLPRRPGRDDRARSPSARRTPTSRPNMVAQSIVHEFCVSGRARTTSIETVTAALAERVERADRGAGGASSRRRSFVAPEGGYFMWVELPEGTDVDALFTAAGERGVHLRQGHGLPARGRREHAAPGLLGRHARTQIDEGIARLAEAYRSLTGTPAAA